MGKKPKLFLFFFALFSCISCLYHYLRDQVEVQKFNTNNPRAALRTVSKVHNIGHPQMLTIYAQSQQIWIYHSKKHSNDKVPTLWYLSTRISADSTWTSELTTHTQNNSMSSKNPKEVKTTLEIFDLLILIGIILLMSLGYLVIVIGRQVLNWTP